MMMTCISTVSYSVLINGEMYSNIIPTRGVRHGCPLSSSYLFLLCVEGLSSLLLKADADSVLEILNQYEVASGQKINLEMSGILFSPNVDDGLKNVILTNINLFE